MEPPASVPSRTVAVEPPAGTPSQISQGNVAKEEQPKGVSMRGRKKHKCIICGNTARSRCPFHACKSCCVKARNPCVIHVIKTNHPPGQLQQSSSSIGKSNLEQPVAVTSMSSSHGPHSKQFSGQILPHAAAGSTNLSSTQQSYDNIRLRTAKSSGHVTRKEATFLNGWRFQKLKEYTEGNLAAEDEAFDRYMQNVSLLEEVFGLNADPLEGLSPEGHLLIPSGNGNEAVDMSADLAKLAAGYRIRFRTSTKRKDIHRQKLRRAIDRSMQKLHRGEQEDAMLEIEDGYMGSLGMRREVKRIKVQSKEGRERLKRMDLFSTIFEKLKHVKNQTDLDTCLKMYEDNFVKKELGTLGYRQRLFETKNFDKKILMGPYSEGIMRGRVDKENSTLNRGNSLPEKANICMPVISRGWLKVDIDKFDLLREWTAASDADLAVL
eukprot:c26635_g1_i1 orf=111-1418(+)